MADKPLVMVTGAGTGIGKATALAFARSGYPLLLLGRRIEPLRALGLDKAVCLSADVRDRGAVLAAIVQGEAAHGPVDCLVNNAGIARLAKVEDQDPDEWRDLIDINCTGVLNCMHAVMPAMKARRHGTIINISSIAGRKSYPSHDVYCGTKFFVHAVSEGARRNMAPFDVRVIVVSPGLTESEIDKTMLNQAALDFWSEGKKKVGAIAAEDVANTILFAYQMPQNVILQELTITPTRQEY
ncbi:MAG: SDR family oxidoreductase [Parvibaculaceae bacterium]